jgi:hypothetical protein
MRIAEATARRMAKLLSRAALDQSLLSGSELGNMTRGMQRACHAASPKSMDQLMVTIVRASKSNSLFPSLYSPFTVERPYEHFGDPVLLLLATERDVCEIVSFHGYQVMQQSKTYCS